MIRHVLRSLFQNANTVPAGKKFLLTHGWLRGNLGDFAITLALVESLRSLMPDCGLTLVSIPGFEKNADRARLLKNVDRMIVQDFTTDNETFFRQHDAVINIAGGGLQNAGDPRGAFMLRDAEQCRRLGIKHCFSSHSFHPGFDLKKAAGSLCVAREPDSFELLQKNGNRSVLSADLAFLLTRHPEPIQRHDRTLLFLRFDHFEEVSLKGNILQSPNRRVELPDDAPVVASSDHDRDYPKLRPFIERHGLRYIRSTDLESLRALISSSGCVVSDRYHPIIFAKMAGVRWKFIERENCLRDSGLNKLIETKTAGELATMARSGLEALVQFVQS